MCGDVRPTPKVRPTPGLLLKERRRSLRTVIALTPLRDVRSGWRPDLPPALVVSMPANRSA
jgi:hypothetical protein